MEGRATHELPFGDYVPETRFGFVRKGKHKSGRLLDGVEWSQFPEVARSGSTDARRRVRGSHMSSPAIVSPRLFECRVPGFICEGVEYSKTVFAQTAGKARYRCLRDLHDAGWESIEFKHIHVRVTESLSMRTIEAFARTAGYRGVPFARIGMRVQVGNHQGIIVGNNDSANFQVFFTAGPHRGLDLNCHPKWMMKYFAPDGRLIAEFGGNQ